VFEDGGRIFSEMSSTQGRKETYGRPGEGNNSLPLKPIFFKNLFSIYLVGQGETNFILKFTFRQLCKESRVET
jgi:hypothetical protein